MPEQSTTPLPTCPMAKACEGMMKKPPSGVATVLPGLLFIVLGVLVVIEPRILVWLIAAALILLGGMMLMMGSFIRKIGTQFHGKQQST
ncbi:hypothetical protein [Aestuariicoccus sp. MJ-SS9]|uniref:hypothetical protein n=1 Tax=Aestuariicoccus sp. MJ-SS9 TaxID=3079855 RepID=UPI00291505D1|nr:hypothetical protein [Aestuariicoccus sp. MJ-SS9]MDU8914223.1 hypothetical protein [Aestuariicoccus sp. MJ-SS9]